MGGSLTVAGLVAMAGGELDKAHYRRYKVLGGEGGGDDYAAHGPCAGPPACGMGKTYLISSSWTGARGSWPWPSRRWVEEMAPEQRPALAAIAKGRAPGEPDRIYVPGRKNPLGLKEGDPALLLVHAPSGRGPPLCHRLSSPGCAKRP